MSKNLLEAAERIAEELTTDEKIQLVRQLEQETLKARWNRLVADTDQRRKGRRFTMDEIIREIKAYRLERRRGINHSRRR